MEKKYVVLALVMAVTASALAPMAFADATSSIDVSLLSYTPYPVAPGSYATFVFKVANGGSADASNVLLKIPQQYPFDANGATAQIENSATPVTINSDGSFSLGTIPANQYTFVEYTTRIAQDAVENDWPLEVWSQTIQGTAADSWFVSSFDVAVQGTDKLQITATPSTLSPGKPTDVVFVINNTGTATVNDVAFSWSEANSKILPLGSGSVKYVDSIAPHTTAEIPFTLVADPSAASGVYVVKVDVSYVIGSSINKTISTNMGMFIGGNSDFDVSVQSSTGGLSLSVANVGSNPATSVSVSIPQQDGFAVAGSSSSFVGNLNPGDFTVVTFNVQRTGNFTQSGRSSGGAGRGNFTPGNFTAPNGQLRVDITYTDTNSNRQTVEKTVALGAFNATSGFRNSATAQEAAGSNSGLTLIAIGIGGIVVIVGAIKYRGKIKAVRTIGTKR